MREGGRGARGRAQQPAEEGGRNQPTAKNRWQTGEMRARVILPEGSSLGGDDDDGAQGVIASVGKSSGVGARREKGGQTTPWALTLQKKQREKHEICSGGGGRATCDATCVREVSGFKRGWTGWTGPGEVRKFEMS